MNSCDEISNKEERKKYGEAIDNFINKNINSSCFNIGISGMNNGECIKAKKEFKGYMNLWNCD